MSNNMDNMDFAVRNQLRRGYRQAALMDNKRSVVNEARRMRRVRRGAFGTSPNNLYNIMAIGTAAVARDDKDDSGYNVVVVSV